MRKTAIPIQLISHNCQNFILTEFLFHFFVITMSLRPKNRYDIIINGGGIVGFTLLNAILKSPQLNRAKVLLIEQAKKPSTLNQPSRKVDKSAISEWNQPNSEIQSEKKFSNRVSSITRSSRLALENLGAWDGLKQYTKDVKSIKVWNYDYSQKIVFKQDSSDELCDKKDRDVMFSVVENNRLSMNILNNILKLNQGRDLIAWNHSLVDLSQSDGTIDAVIQNKESDEETIVSAPLILGCDGFKSKVRDFAQLKYFERDLNKTAVVGTVKMSAPVNMLAEQQQLDYNATAYQRFSAEKDTVAALLPLDDEYSSFVISAPSDYSKFLLDCDEKTFVFEFNQLLSRNEFSAILQGISSLSTVFSEILDNNLQSFKPSSNFTKTASLDNEFDRPPTLDSVLEGSRAAFPLVFGTTTPKMIASLHGRDYPQIALLGDSSHRIHPLAGQGLNLGIQDAIELVRQLDFVATHGERIFDDNDHYAIARALKRYERNRQLYIAPMSAGILSMPHLFKLLPSKILAGVNKCDPIKSMSVRFANGYY